MRVLLIDVPVSPEDRFGSMAKFGSSSPPFNLLLLGTLAKQLGHDVHITAENYSIKRLVETAQDFKPDIIGLTCMSISYPSFQLTASTLKRTCPTAAIVCGGYHVSLNPEMILSMHPEVNVAFCGEGDISFPNFLHTLESEGLEDSALNGIKGICYRDRSGEIITNEPEAPVENLDSIPFPDYSLLPNYFKTNHGSVNRHYLSSPQAFALVSRGCPFSCKFCGRQILGSKIRMNSNEYIVDLFSYFKKEFGVKSIIFGDEFFTANPKKTANLCDNLIREGLDTVHWSCSGRVSNVDLAMAQGLRAAGCRQVALGCESGSQRMLNLINKKTTVEKMSTAIRDFSNAGVDTYGSFVLAFPGEDEESLKATHDFILTNPLTYVAVLFFTPYPGCHFVEQTDLREAGTILSDDLSKYNAFDTIQFIPNGLTKERLLEARRGIYKGFYLRPARIMHEFKHVLNPASWRYALRLLGF